MWASHILLMLRLMARNRVQTAINVFGLALGLAGCLLILTYIRYERSYDAWLPDSERVYQVQATWHEPGQPITKSQNSPFPVRDTLAGGFSEVEAITVVRSGQTVTKRKGEALFIDSSGVDPAFFDIFKLPFVDGSAATALPNVNSIVLTESEALKQFGTSRVVGRTMSLGAGEGRRDYLVSGVLRDLPKNTSLKFGILFREDTAQAASIPAEYRGWGNMGQQHYVKLRPGTDVGAINAALPAWEKRVVAPQMIGGKSSSQADIMDLKLVPIQDVHLGEAQANALRPGGDRRTLATFAIVALLTLGMAVMNFVNLSTARATQRAREVALRKVLGATRRQLVVQFLVETIAVAGLAMLVALSIVELALPWVSSWAGADLRMAYFTESGMFVPALAIFAATAVLGGLYPALYLSRFKPAQVLRANKSAAETPGSGRLRTTLVVLQFAIAIGLGASTWVIWSQTRHVETVDPGYRRDGLIQIDSAWRFAGDPTEYDAARRELLQVPGVVAAGRTNLGIAANNKTIQAVRAPGAPDGLSIGVYRVDPDFFRTMDMRLLAGRLFDERQGMDLMPRTAEGPLDNAVLMSRGVNVVINRNAAMLLGHGSPQAAIGKQIRVSLDGNDLAPATIAGVVEDTRIRTARDAIEPLIYTFDLRGTEQVIVRYAAARPGEVLEGIEKIWRKSPAAHAARVA